MNSEQRIRTSQCQQEGGRTLGDKNTVCSIFRGLKRSVPGPTVLSGGLTPAPDPVPFDLCWCLEFAHYPIFFVPLKGFSDRKWLLLFREKKGRCQKLLLSMAMATSMVMSECCKQQCDFLPRGQEGPRLQR